MLIFLFSPGHRARASTAESCCGWAGGSQWSGATEHQPGGQCGGQRKPLLQVSRGETEYVKAEERRDATAGSQVCSPLQRLCVLPTVACNILDVPTIINTSHQAPYVLFWSPYLKKTEALKLQNKEDLEHSVVGCHHRTSIENECSVSWAQK